MICHREGRVTKRTKISNGDLRIISTGESPKQGSEDLENPDPAGDGLQFRQHRLCRQPNQNAPALKIDFVQVSVGKIHAPTKSD